MPDLEMEDLQAALQYAARRLNIGAGRMIIWIDAQMSPAIAVLTEHSGTYSLVYPDTQLCGTRFISSEPLTEY